MTDRVLPGLESSSAWRPKGGLIVFTENEVRPGPQDAQNSGEYDIVFFERNGLRHVYSATSA